MPDFWPHCGFNLAGRDAEGKLTVTDSLLRAWWRRPEVSPVPESCDAERQLHAALLAEPRRTVSESELRAMRDADAIDNYRVVLALRSRLLGASTLESAYLDIFRGGNVTVPPIFIDQLAQMIVRSLLDGTEDALEARAAELFFRPQRVSLQDGVVMLADAETVDLHQSGGTYGDLGRLLVQNKTKPRSVVLDVIDRDNAQSYWERNERYDTVMSFAYGGAALTAFCRVVEKWLRHFYGTQVAVKPVPAIEEKRWAWHIGLDAEATGMLNDLYHGKQLGKERQRRILSLFQLDFAESSMLRPDVAGRPVYLACAMNNDGVLRVKPQNLLLNLPLASSS
jgi:hypothetical protein